MANIELYSRKADLLPEKKTEPLIEQLRQAFYDAGLEPPTGPIQTDGQIHRFSTGDKPGDDAGWYLIYGDNIPAGVIGNWRTGETHNFRAHVDRRLSLAEEAAIQADIARARKRREEATRIKHEQAAATVAEIWDAAQLASPEHPYLSQKQVQTHGARIASDGRLILPLYNESGALSSLQYIDATGRKQYHPGGAVGSCYYMMGDTSGSETIYIAEGFATAATICETMHAPTVAAYSANNLPGVTAIMRAKNPLSEIVIVADNDASKTGENYATQAAAKHGARVVLIPAEGQDANDFALAGGDLVSLLKPSAERTFFTSDTELLKDPEPIKWIIKKWLPERSTCIIHGASGLGKTFTVLDMILSIAYKKEWNGKKIHNQFVAYMAGEGHAGIRWRVRAWRQHNGITDHGKIFFSNGARTIDTPEGLLFVMSELRALEQKPRVIVVDTVHKHFSGEENSNTDVGLFIRAMDTLKEEFDATVIAIHHSGHSEGSQKRSRGAGAFKDDVDVSIALYEDGGETVLEQTKQKDAQKEMPVGIRIEQVAIDGVFDEDGDQVTSAISIPFAIEPKENTKKPREVGVKKADRDTLLRMWRYSGTEIDQEGRPFMSLSAMKRYAKEIEGKTEKQSKEWMNPAKPSSLVARLLKESAITWSEEGCRVIDEELKSVFLIQK